ncbi:MAG: hypothetical protein DI556_02135 [Rhodovulum sulfidophilum]|uniref:Uncharacterized protein n=1 Tax=Rhodovulum sulfidophilum TaxID=35806 RepID=A0A2W5QCI5_RHOSU|nr:MAG: hypothetical protein DI556_02135 [Rhodovulum sulfidophilum]
MRDLDGTELAAVGITARLAKGSGTGARFGRHELRVIYAPPAAAVKRARGRSGIPPRRAEVIGAYD